MRPSNIGLACALFATCATAKVVALSVGAPTSATAWLGCLAPDALVCLLFAGATRTAPRVLAAALYALLVLYLAVNAALVHALGTPLVIPMLQGFDGVMQDSAAHYLHVRALWPALVVGTLGAVAPRATRRLSVTIRGRLAWGGAALATVGWLAPAPPPAQRNAIVALVQSAMPRAWAAPTAALDDARDPQPAPLEAGLENLATRARGRSVVVVVLESAAARFIGAYGAEPDAMPFFSSLARASLLCTTAWAVYPESIKGQLALWHSAAPAPDLSVNQHARVPVPGLATLLDARGYATGLFHAGRFRFLGMDAVLGRSGFGVMADAAVIGGAHESSFGVDEESTVAALLAFVDKLPPAQPFFAAYLPVAGHHPYASPPGGPFRRDDVRDCYRAALHYADRAVCALWQGLCARRPADDLLLCIVGDHGQAFGEHAGNFGHTFALYEENLHVPLLFCAPGLTDAGLVCRRVVSHLDVAPTLLHLLGDDACPTHQGASILLPQARRAFAFTDWGDPLVAVRDGAFKYIRNVGHDTDALYDLCTDPLEHTSLATVDPLRTATYRRAALAWVGATRAAVAAW